MKVPKDFAAAKRVQTELRDRVVLRDDFGKLSWIAGADVGFEDNGKVARGAIAVLTFPELELVETAIARRPTELPYVPGYLSFREIPVILDALNKIRKPVEMIVCDGHGFAHPRRFGLACHLGIELNIPTIGAAKSRLIGKFRSPAAKRGSKCQLTDEGERIGYVVRTRTGTKPLFVSPGHRVSFESACQIVLTLCPKFRLPETTRQADRLSRN